MENKIKQLAEDIVAGKVDLFEATDNLTDDEIELLGALLRANKVSPIRVVPNKKIDFLVSKGISPSIITKMTGIPEGTIRRRIEYRRMKQKKSL